jgi:hypothetical protein
VKSQQLNIKKTEYGMNDGLKNAAGRLLYDASGKRLYEYDVDNRKVRQNPKNLMQIQRFGSDHHRKVHIENQKEKKNMLASETVNFNRT